MTITSLSHSCRTKCSQIRCHTLIPLCNILVTDSQSLISISRTPSPSRSPIPISAFVVVVVLLPADGSVESIQHVLRQSATSFRSSEATSRSIPEAAAIPKFSYEALPDAEAFFLPYSWQLVCAAKPISIDTEHVMLFIPKDAVEEEVHISSPCSLIKYLLHLPCHRPLFAGV